MTFSIVAYDPNSAEFGIAVQSKFLCVGAVVPWAKANIGAIATQAHANTSYGTKGLNYLKQGLSAEKTLYSLLKNDPMKEHRQLGIVDTKGNAATFTGKECFYWAGGIVGDNFACQGNILISEDTVESMTHAYETTKGDLASRLLSALHAADKKGRGDVRGKQSASLLVVKENGGYGGYTDRYIDIRVDEHEEPIKELSRIFQIYDITMLSREKSEYLVPIEGDLVKNIKEILTELNYLPSDALSRPYSWGEPENKALDNWVGINNFENRMTQSGKIWMSLYKFMLNEKGTPMVELKSMNQN